MADILATLPTDNTPASPEEESLVDSLLKMTGESSSDDNGGIRWLTLLKATLILTSIFIVLASPWIGDLFRKIPGLNSPTLSLFMQAAVFMVITGMSLWLLSK